MASNVGERRFKLRRRQCLTAWPHYLAPETEAAIDRAGMQGLQEHSVGIAMYDALVRRARLVTDRVAELFRRDLGFTRVGHELPGDRVMGEIAPIDQRRHLGRDGDRHRL